MQITNHDLHVMLTRIEERQKTIAEKVDLANRWQAEHEKKDEERFNSLNKYAASIAIVSSAITAGLAYLWNMITGKA